MSEESENLGGKKNNNSSKVRTTPTHHPNPLNPAHPFTPTLLLVLCPPSWTKQSLLLQHCPLERCSPWCTYTTSWTMRSLLLLYPLLNYAITVFPISPPELCSLWCTCIPSWTMQSLLPLYPLLKYAVSDALVSPPELYSHCYPYFPSWLCSLWCTPHPQLPLPIPLPQGFLTFCIRCTPTKLSICSRTPLQN